MTDALPDSSARAGAALEPGAFHVSPPNGDWDLEVPCPIQRNLPPNSCRATLDMTVRCTGEGVVDVLVDSPESIPNSAYSFAGGIQVQNSGFRAKPKSRR